MPKTRVIFDVDGTLVDSCAFDDELYGAALTDVLGKVHVRPSWEDYEHKTDSGILREVCLENGLELQACEAQVRDRFGQLIATYLETSGVCRPTPGGPALIEALRSEPGVSVGIATGGWAHTALMKLRAAGYGTAGLVLASADDAFTRAEILGIARARLPRSEAAIYVGDGEWGRRACEAVGWTFVGIGERLRGRCRHWIADFLTRDVIDAVLGCIASR